MKKTTEDFDRENEARKQVEFRRCKLPYVKVGQIWWYYVGLNIGQEISKGSPYLRPCLILKVLKNTTLIRIVPLTTKGYKKHIPGMLELRNYRKFGLKKSWLHTLYVSSIDRKRLLKIQSNERVSKILCKKILLNL